MLLLGARKARVFAENQKEAFKTYINCYETVLSCERTWSLRSTMLDLKVFSFCKTIINLETSSSTIINFKFWKGDSDLFSKWCLYPGKYYQTQP